MVAPSAPVPQAIAPSTVMSMSNGNQMMMPMMPMMMQPMYSMPSPMMYHQPVNHHQQQQPMNVIPQQQQPQQTKDYIPVSESEGVAAAAELAARLRATNDSKTVNSEFLSFVEKVAEGSIKVGNETLTDRNGVKVDWNSIYTSAAPVSQEGEKTSDNHASEENDIEALFNQFKLEQDNALKSLFEREGKDGETTEDVFARLTREMGLMGQGGIFDDVDEGLFSSQGNSMERFFSDGPFIRSIQNNPFSSHANPMEVAREMITANDRAQAMAALEEVLSRNPKNSEAWRELGFLHADEDRDVEAIICFRRSHDADPYDTESMLALGVCLTNEMDTPEALKLLQKWLSSHPDFADLPGVNDPLPDNFPQQMAFIRQLFERATRTVADPDALTGLGVVGNITREFNLAIDSFLKACDARPTDHRSWNKLGATLANSSKHEQAIAAYHAALALNPTYPRAWSNLATSHANLGRHEEALSFYATACALSPQAGHLWHYLHTVVLTLGRMELLKFIDNKDISGMLASIPSSTTPDALPKPLEGANDIKNLAANTLGLIRKSMSE